LKTTGTEYWRRRKLGDFFRLKHGYAFKGRFFSETGPYIVLTPGNFFDEGGFKHKEKEKFYTGDIPNGFILSRGDLLVAMTEQKYGLLGSPAIIPEDNLYLHNQRLGLVTDLKNEELWMGYLYYLFNSHEVRAQIQATANGAKVRHTSPSRIYEVEVNLPPLPVQRKISSILSAYDDLIENNLRRIKILEEMAQALYREWFVNFRFPGHEKVRMVDSPLGKIPEEWEIKDLGSLLEIKRGKTITKKTVSEGDVPVVAGGLQPAYFHNQANTMQPVITVSASGANAGFVNLYSEDVWASDCSFVDINTTPHVYYYYLMFKDRQIEITGLQRGAAQPHVYPQDLMRLEAVGVSLHILDVFDQKVTPVFQLIKTLSQKNTNLRQTRDLLLPKLISGEFDVSNLDINIPEEAA